MRIEDLPDRLQQDCERIIADGEATRGQVEAALAFMNEVAELELLGAISPDEARRAVAEFARLQVLRGRT